MKNAKGGTQTCSKPDKAKRLYHVFLDRELYDTDCEPIYYSEPATVCARTPAEARYMAWLQEVPWEARGEEWPFQAFLQRIVKGVRPSGFQRKKCGTEKCPCR